MEPKKFDLEERTTAFGKQIVIFCKKLPKNNINLRLIPQVIGSAGSIGANYREANDSLGKKDFVHRLKIARKESKEVSHWLVLLEAAHPEFTGEVALLSKEAKELTNILSAIIKKFL